MIALSMNWKTCETDSGDSARRTIISAEQRMI